MNNRVVLIAAIMAGFLALGAGLGMYTARLQAPATPAHPGIEGLLWPNPKQIGPFSAVTQHGGNFGLGELAGKWSFLFFGYTHCPDICPLTLTALNEVYRELAQADAAGNVQIVFVTVDPERDTPEQLAGYVNYFNSDFIGLGGTREQIESLTRQIGVVSMRGNGTSPDDYTVDHTAAVFLLDPAVRLVGLFSAPQVVEDAVTRFLAIRDFLGKQS